MPGQTTEPTAIAGHLPARRESYGKGTRVEWDRESMSKYTQLRTGTGGFGSWLHKIRRRDDPRCAHCEDDDETGNHIVFECRRPDRLALR